MAQVRQHQPFRHDLRSLYTIGMSLRRTRLQLISAVAGAALIAATVAVVQTPAEATRQPAPGPAVAATHTVTLVTGDVVTVTTLAGGKQVAEVDRPDGATGGVRLQESRGDLYVLPDEALGLMHTGRLDRRLFNVTDLIEMGYDDAKTGGVPLIATYAPAAGGRGAADPVAPRGSRLSRKLASIGGAALNEDKKQARTFWTTVAPRGTFAGGVAKLWLDGRKKVNLAESVPQVGAPQAWAAGYTGAGVTVAVLDSGVDATHPDLVDQIDNKVSFVPGEDTSDPNGHGTHVASTIVGTGAASGGANKGVAPGADLIVGKVLGNDGFGQDSWVLAGMQWAAESGADVVSMSLGDNIPSDGSDPMSMAVDALSAQYGTLFVIASGNSGPETIPAPGAAASALTVGAVDKQDNLAYFSGTGPLTGTAALKPDLTAPGVDINAARSATSAGEGPYTLLSGTSMATPHVAGAAAILAQRHPDWSGPQLKQALMSSAKGLADFYSPYEVGTGRLDVAAAVGNAGRATGSLFFGNFDWPHEPSDAPVAKPVTFTNSGTVAVTLNLALVGTGPFTLGAQSVTVPAGGTADVSVTGDPTVAAFGRLTGYLVGTDAATGAAVTRTSLGLVKEDERYDLTVKLRDRSGAPADGWVVLNRTGDWFPWAIYVSGGEGTARLIPGAYTVASELEVAGEKPDALGFAVLVDPVVMLNAPTEVVLDARRARLLQTEAPERTEDRQRKIDYQVEYGDGNSYRSAYQIPVKYDNLYVSPTKAIPQGSFELVTRYRKGQPMLSLRALGLLSFDTTVQPGSALTAGSDQLRAVYAGTGAAGEYAKVNARGKLVVVKRSDAVAPAERAAAAAAAGASLLVVVNDGPGILNEYVGESPIPVATVHRDIGALLIWLARTGLTKLSVTRVPYTDVVYDLTRNYSGQVPDRPLTYRPSHRDLARIDARYYGVRDIEGAGYRWDMTFTPSFGFLERERHPGTRAEWVTPEQEWHEVHGQGMWVDTANRNTYAKGSVTRLDWFAPAIRPAFNRAFAVQNGRFRDFMTVNIQTWSPSGEVLEHGGNMDWGSVPTNLKLYQGDHLIRENPFNSDLQFVEVPSGTLPYHLVLDASRPAEEWRLSTRTHTEWDFVSSSNEAENFVPFALMQLDYSLETDLHGDVKAGTTQKISVTAGPQRGGTGIGTVRSVTLDVSYDDGATWLPVTLTRGTDGRWNATLKLAKQPGFLSVRAAAATNAGWSISQEIIRAYGLR